MVAVDVSPREGFAFRSGPKLNPSRTVRRMRSRSFAEMQRTPPGTFSRLPMCADQLEDAKDEGGESDDGD
jgi:hypothetical protein